MKQDVQDRKMISSNMQTVSDFKDSKSHNPKSMSQSFRSKIIKPPTPTDTPNKTKLKLYGPLKVQRYDMGESEEKPIIRIPGSGYSGANSTKKIIFSDKDNNWNNPRWCKDEKLKIFYHDDKLRRDCISMDNLMQATLRDEKKKFKSYKG